MKTYSFARIACTTACLTIAATSPALAGPWVLLLQPKPYSAKPLSYDRWQPYKKYDSREECLDARRALHSDYWMSDLDFSKRALAGVCRDEETGTIATGQ